MSDPYPDLTGDELYVLAVDVMRGRTPDQSRLAPLTEAQRRYWDDVRADVADAEARGVMTEMPFE